MPEVARPASALALAALLLGLAGCAPYYIAPRMERAVGATQEGEATWYGGRFNGRKTASGERFDERELTAAHRTLPFGAQVLVTNKKNGRTVIVRINDRGPYGGGLRIIDLSKGAAAKIDMIRAGVVPVVLEVLSLPPPRTKKAKSR